MGFDVIASTSADLPHDPRRIEPDEVITWISQNLNDDAQALFIGANGFRVVSAIERLEQRVGRPDLTANQVLLWSLLKRAGVRMDVSGYGSLFQQRPPGTGPGHSQAADEPLHLDALATLGVELTELPFTRERIFAGLQSEP